MSFDSKINILEEANHIIHDARNADYGSPLDNHTLTAQLWGAYLGIKMTPEQVCMCNILQKISRSTQKMTRDTIVDIAGYAGNIEMVQDEKARRDLYARSLRPGAEGEAALEGLAEMFAQEAQESDQAIGEFTPDIDLTIGTPIGNPLEQRSVFEKAEKATSAFETQVKKEFEALGMEAGFDPSQVSAKVVVTDMDPRLKQEIALDAQPISEQAEATGEFPPGFPVHEVPSRGAYRKKPVYDHSKPAPKKD